MVTDQTKELYDFIKSRLVVNSEGRPGLVIVDVLQEIERHIQLAYNKGKLEGTLDADNS